MASRETGGGSTHWQIIILFAISLKALRKKYDCNHSSWINKLGLSEANGPI